jgi:hypothetical protein
MLYFRLAPMRSRKAAAVISPWAAQYSRSDAPLTFQDAQHVGELLSRETFCLEHAQIRRCQPCGPKFRLDARARAPRPLVEGNPVVRQADEALASREDTLPGEPLDRPPEQLRIRHVR